MHKRFLVSAVIMGLLFSKTLVHAEDKKYENMVLIPAGEYTIGLTPDQVKDIVNALEGMEKYHDNAQPAHKEKISAFYMDKYEVTNKQYKEFVDATKRTPPEYWEEGTFPKGLADHPVVNVTWNDAVAYAQWKGKRLPTEFEWEAAARGNDGRVFPWGSKFEGAKTNCEDSGPGKTMPVGSYKNGVSPFGCFDMAGNVAEWTASNYLAYPNCPFSDEFFGKERFVVRGGSWYAATYETASTFRFKYTPISDYEDVGFRCAVSP